LTRRFANFCSPQNDALLERHDIKRHPEGYDARECP
jgi:hypothetical protein